MGHTCSSDILLLFYIYLNQKSQIPIGLLFWLPFFIKRIHYYTLPFAALLYWSDPFHFYSNFQILSHKVNFFSFFYFCNTFVIVIIGMSWRPDVDVELQRNFVVICEGFLYSVICSLIYLSFLTVDVVCTNLRC